MDDPILRRRTFGWLMFDWASQPFYTLCLTFVFGPYFAATLAEALLSGGLTDEAADARAQVVWSRAQTWIGVTIALVAPFMGALADTGGRKLPWIAGFSALYVIGTAGLWLMVPDASNVGIVLVSFGLAMIGAEMTTIFTNAILPSLGTGSRIGRLSGYGFALGYAGGVVALFLMLLLFAESEEGVTLLGNPPALGFDGDAREGTRFVGPFTALWFVLFMVPFFLYVRDDPEDRRRASASRAWSELKAMVRSIPGRPSLAAWLAGSMLYRDALVALYAFGGVYAALVMGWEVTQIGVFGILGAVTAALATYLGGRLDGRFGPKPVITASVLILTGVVAALVATSREMVLGLPVPEGSAAPDIALYLLGAVIGGAGGVLQAASRTMMVRHADPARPTEAFGLYALSGKATAFLAPLLIGIATQATGSARLGIAPVALLFIAGLILLVWVRPEGDGVRAPEETVR